MAPFLLQTTMQMLLTSMFDYYPISDAVMTVPTQVTLLGISETQSVKLCGYCETRCCCGALWSTGCPECFCVVQMHEGVE